MGVHQDKILIKVILSSKTEKKKLMDENHYSNFIFPSPNSVRKSILPSQGG